ncbi:MAG: DL-endopeptidase inhibitor IseA family protein [Bacilli bacterium]
MKIREMFERIIENQWFIRVAIAILAIVVIILGVNLMSKDARQEREAKKLVVENYEKLLVIHSLGDVFKIDNEVVEMNGLQYKKITNYEELINGMFTENGKNVVNENLRDYILRIADVYYLKLDELNNETEYKNSKYIKVDVKDNRIEYNVNTKINFIDQKGTLENKIVLVKENNKWLIDDYKIEEYTYVYKD